MAKIRKLLGTAEDTEAAFYDAISRADIDALMALWADEEDILCIHPGAARLVGHVAIRASWEAIFERGGVHIRPRQLRITQNVMTAIHNIVEEINQADNEHQEIHIVATNIYLKTPQGWRIVVHHASVAPGSISSEQTASSMLH
ncbi:MAG TPA: nuclear transport factor 2 family protein [Burkholderiaceae bacterium]|jgi:ketosteroid isomerase-like protein|nr:nuclear transport factor 2 family protein [Burkholderiaceae bacterium]